MKNKLKVGGILAVSAVTLFAPFANTYASKLRSHESMVTIAIQREINGVENSVDNTFSYEISEADTNPAKVTGIPSNITIDFTNKIATNNAVVGYTVFDTSDMDFTKVGDYEFIIREVASTNSFDYPVDEDSEYRFLMSTRNVLDNDGKITGDLETTLSEYVLNKNGEKTKDVIFAKNATRSKIEISNTLAGNYANTDEYFKYKLAINASANEKYSIKGQDETVTYDGKEIKTVNEIESGSEVYVYLKHSQRVVIGDNGRMGEIPVGANYTVTEMDADSYATTISEGGISGKETGVKNVVGLPLEDDVAAQAEYLKSNFSSFTNTREANVLTGVASNILPFVVIAMLGAVGFIVSRKFANV